ncbi:prolyl-tRNA synthetase [Candidatus Saccharibacteria bacterium]|nr:prolyl-tRNA synthetase [Candidatus Saccharibacteria bacterium]
MKLSNSFVKTLRSAPKDETAKSAQYLIRAGYVHKEMAGLYDFLPLGLRVLENIKTIIREELNKIEAQELQLTALQNPEPWQKTGRFDDQEVDIWFKTELSSGGELGLAPTHEEPLTNLMRTYIESYKDLPIYAYQFQTKFRNELRAKSGILRTREFLMKDLYSFSADEKSHAEFYRAAEQAYKRIYDRLGLGDSTYETFASGGIFAKFSHEFQTILDVGEDTIYYNEDKSVVLNEEVLLPDVLEELGVKKEELKSARAAEVGNIFTLKDKYSKPLGLEFTDKDGKRKTVYMGCYGIGVSRVMGVIAEKYADDDGLVWPENIAPYKTYLIAIGEKAAALAREYEAEHPETILYDDRDARPGEKFKDADLLGLPTRVVISDKTLETGSAEVKDRRTGETTLLPLDELARFF